MSQELFWTVFAAIGQAVGAIATAAAVIVTLWQVRYVNKKKLKMKFTDKNAVLSERGNSRYLFVNLSVTNIGNRTVIVRNWGMKVPKKSNYLFVQDMTNPMINILQKPLPYSLETECTIDLVFDLNLFLKNLKEQTAQGSFAMNDKLSFYVIDTTGKEYSLKIKKTIKQLIEEHEKNV